jgi:hypothetical protein
MANVLRLVSSILTDAYIYKELWKPILRDNLSYPKLLLYTINILRDTFIYSNTNLLYYIWLNIG